MPDALTFSLIGFIILATHCLEGITGFGSAVVALPFIGLLIGIQPAVPILLLQTWALALIVAIESWRRVAWREYARILVMMAIGLPVGVWLIKVMPDMQLAWLLAAFMIIAGGHGLFEIAAKGLPREQLPPLLHRALSGLLVLAGVIHGAFGTGGPLLVVYANKAIPDKSLFRVTLCLIWLTLNTILIVQKLVMQEIAPHILWMGLGCLPFTLAGLGLGNLIHYRVNELRFRSIVYTALIVSGITLAVSTLMKGGAL
jgi:uncharacterized membrane protein YfcA